MKDGDAHGPEAMRKHRERDGGPGAKKVDREMTGVDSGEVHRHEDMKDLVRTHHRNRDRRHHPFGSAALPRGIADGNGQQSEKQRDAHVPKLSWSLLPVNNRQPVTLCVASPIPATEGHS